MKRTLNWWDLMWFSIGAVVGAGNFVITGIQARDVAGPAILLSYVAAGFSSMLSVFIYTEFALEVPTAGRGMTTVLLVGTVSQARYETHIARTHMLPPWFAHIDQRTGTPVRVTVASLVLTSAVTLFTSLSVLSNLLSISTLMIFLLVAVALLVRCHYMPGGQTSPQTMWRLLSLIFLIFGASVGIAAYWALSDGWVGHAIFGGIWFGLTWCLWYFVPIVRMPKEWGMPWILATSIGTNCFLWGPLTRSPLSDSVCSQR